VETLIQAFKSIVLAVILITTPLAQAKVEVNLIMEYIELTANNPKDLLNKLRIVKSPIWGDAYAWVHSDTVNGTAFDTSDSGCKIHGFESEIDITITITLPRWVNVADQSEKDQKWWARLIEFITDHEL
jgi:hypothetical protein